YVCWFGHRSVFKIGVSIFPEQRIKLARKEYIKRWGLTEENTKHTILENAVLTGEPEIIVSLQTKYAYVLEQFFLDSIYRNAEIISKELKQRNINYCGSLVRGEVFEYQDEKTEKMINVLKYLSKLEQNKIDTFGEI